MDRNAKILTAINRQMRIIELGPSFGPVAPKRDGWNAVSVDHATRDELVEKYRNEPGVNTENIEDVDVIWREGPLDLAFPSDQLGTFDACIASHVIEHIPDPIGLCKSLERLLKPNGIFSLAVPDKRFCFDFFKQVSSVGELLEAHERKAVRHSRKTRFDFEAYSVRSAGEHAWGQRPVTDVRLFLTLEEAKRGLESHQVEPSSPYVDFHAWHFTPSSFALVVLELAEMGELNFGIDRSFPTEGFEFYVTLNRGCETLEPDVLEARRLELLHRTLFEIREQTEFLPAVIASRQATAVTETPTDEGNGPLRAAIAAIRMHVRARTRLRAAGGAARDRLTRRS